MTTIEAQQARNKHLHECRVKLGEARRALALAKRFVPDNWGADCQQALKQIVAATDAINELESDWDARYLRERNERWGF